MVCAKSFRVHISQLFGFSTCIHHLVAALMNYYIFLPATSLRWRPADGWTGLGGVQCVPGAASTTAAVVVCTVFGAGPEEIETHGCPLPTTPTTNPKDQPVVRYRELDKKKIKTYLRQTRTLEMIINDPTGTSSRRHPKTSKVVVRPSVRLSLRAIGRSACV